MKNACALLLTVALVSACEKPGEGKLADEGRKHGDAIIVALEKYHSDKTTYPNSLNELLPTYLSATQLGQLTSKPMKFRYERTSDKTFMLEFRYSGPGSNICFIESGSEQREWNCVRHW